MPGSDFLLDVLTDEPTSTSDLYSRAGYARLMQHGLIPYHAFRDALAALCAQGLVESQLAQDGATLWRLRTPQPGP